MYKRKSIGKINNKNYSNFIQKITIISKFIHKGTEKMKKFYSLIMLISIFSIFINLNEVKAVNTYTGKLVIHYHRYDENYANYELYTWDYDATGAAITVAPIRTDAFGGVYEIEISSDAQDELGLVLKERDTWNKDGVDVNRDNEIDNKIVDIKSLRGTSNTMHVYIMQGAADVYYQDVLSPTYFGKPGYGNVVIVYYNPSDDWADFMTWNTESDLGYEDVSFDYRLGLDGGMDPNLFRVGVINIGNDAYDQIGFVARKDKSWDVKDTDWTDSVSEDETDDNGHTYKTTGDRFINVTDVAGSGFKFIYAIYGIKTLYEDFDAFIDEALKLNIITAQFNSIKTLSIGFNLPLTYGETGHDKGHFEVKDQDGLVIPIERINFNATSDKNFEIIVQNKIEQGKAYTVTYNYEQFSKQKSSQAEVNVNPELFTQPIREERKSYTPYIVVGFTALTTLVIGFALLYVRKK